MPDGVKILSIDHHGASNSLFLAGETSVAIQSQNAPSFPCGFISKVDAARKTIVWTNYIGWHSTTSKVVDIVVEQTSGDLIALARTSKANSAGFIYRYTSNGTQIYSVDTGNLGYRMRGLVVSPEMNQITLMGGVQNISIFAHTYSLNNGTFNFTSPVTKANDNGYFYRCVYRVPKTSSFIALTTFTNMNNKQSIVLWFFNPEKEESKIFYQIPYNGDLLGTSLMIDEHETIYVTGSTSSLGQFLLSLNMNSFSIKIVEWKTKELNSPSFISQRKDSIFLLGSLNRSGSELPVVLNFDKNLTLIHEYIDHLNPYGFYSLGVFASNTDLFLVNGTDSSLVKIDVIDSIHPSSITTDDKIKPIHTSSISKGSREPSMSIYDKIYMLIDNHFGLFVGILGGAIFLLLLLLVACMINRRRKTIKPNPKINKLTKLQKVAVGASTDNLAANAQPLGIDSIVTQRPQLSIESLEATPTEKLKTSELPVPAASKSVQSSKPFAQGLDRDKMVSQRFKGELDIYNSLPSSSANKGGQKFDRVKMNSVRLDQRKGMANPLLEPPKTDLVLKIATPDLESMKVNTIKPVKIAASPEPELIKIEQKQNVTPELELQKRETPKEGKKNTADKPPLPSLVQNPPLLHNTTTAFSHTTKTFVNALNALSLPLYRQLNLDTSFTVIRELKQGGFGKIFHAKIKDQKLASEYKCSFVAIKYLVLDNVEEQYKASMIKSFEQEIAILNSYSMHPYIVTFVGYSVEPRALVMKFYELGDLETFIMHDQKVAGFEYGHEILLKLLINCSFALTTLHTDGIAHLDLKPNNVLLEKRGKDLVAVLCDFGTAKVNNEVLLGVKGFTKADVHGGSAAYVAPERLNAEDGDNTYPADIYSFGIMMYCGLSRSIPWKNMTFNEVRTAVLKGERPKMSRKGVSLRVQALINVMEQCWHQDPLSRPQIQYLTDMLQGIQNEKN